MDYPPSAAAHPEDSDRSLTGSSPYTYGSYADAATENGDKLARKLYFSPLYHVSDTAYVLDLRKPGISKAVRTFQECLSHQNKMKDIIG